MATVEYPVMEEVEVPDTNGNLFKTVMSEGYGPPPPPGAKVGVHYVGKFDHNNRVFDSSRERNEKFAFEIGKGGVIKGWDVGVATMKKGEIAILKCLPLYAYGADGHPPDIPPNCTLRFEIELFDWTVDISEKQDWTLQKSVQTVGEGDETAGYESECTFNIYIKNTATNAQLCDKKGVVATLGEALLPTGVDVLLPTMRKAESAMLIVAGSLVAENEAYGVPSNTTLTCYVTLTSFTAAPGPAETVATDEKIAAALRRKDQGNEYFKAGSLALAKGKYARALEFLTGCDSAEASQVKIPVLSNLAAVLLKTQDYAGVIANCDKCIEASGAVPQPKALFRRAKARYASDDWEGAREDLKRCLAAEPGNGDAINELALVQTKIKAQKKKEKEAFGGLFEKMTVMEIKEEAKVFMASDEYKRQLAELYAEMENPPPPGEGEERAEGEVAPAAAAAESGEEPTPAPAEQ